MMREKVLKESKNYLMDIHENLRRAFRTASSSENRFIDNVLNGIENDVKQIEALEETIQVEKIKTKRKNLDTIIEE